LVVVLTDIQTCLVINDIVKVWIPLRYVYPSFWFYSLFLDNITCHTCS